MRCFRDAASGPLNAKSPLACPRYGAPAGGCTVALEADCVRHPDLGDGLYYSAPDLPAIGDAGEL
jgi:hypothetical protein